MTSLISRNRITGRVLVAPSQLECLGALALGLAALSATGWRLAVDPSHGETVWGSPSFSGAVASEARTERPADRAETGVISLSAETRTFNVPPHRSPGDAPLFPATDAKGTEQPSLTDLAHAPLSLSLAGSAPSWRVLRDSDLRHAAHPPSSSNAGADLERFAKSLAADWRAPPVRDLSLFVATDDEGLSWSFTKTSPNFGRLVYQEERVDFGRFSAGVAMQQADASFALAYLEEDGPSKFGVDTGEDYVGVVMTYRR